MVGEIRDEETARIAIQASLTGHLVLSTLHTNDAAGAIIRLVDLGLEPYLVGASLACVLAQRLVRRVHTPCAGDGCEGCFRTGFLGRIGVFELLPLDEPVRALVNSGGTASAIREAARGRGMRTLREAGMDLVSRGVTTRVEVERVAHMVDGVDAGPDSSGQAMGAAASDGREVPAAGGNAVGRAAGKGERRLSAEVPA
jgi:general secretion pathway protein E